MKKKKILPVISAVLLCTTLTACGYESRPTLEVKPLEKTSETTYPKELEKFYTQKIEWKTCEDSKEFECTKIIAPLDYENSNGKTITLEAKRSKAENPIGTLFLNPGGPGGSGMEFVETFYTYLASETVVNTYDIVGFDPRGVGKSSPVKCLTDEELDEKRYESQPATDEESVKESIVENNELAEKCEKTSGDIYKYINTISVAKDLDIWRHLVGDNYLNYFGYSYGTSLGATYIELFPNNTGRMVLDGVVDTQLSLAELNVQQAKGFEIALKGFANNCIESKSCPIKGDDPETVAKEIMKIVEALGDKGIESEGRFLNSSLAFEGIAAGLYNEAMHENIQEGLHQLIEDKNPKILLELADQMAGRGEDGHYDNSNEALQTIDYLDYSKESLSDEEYKKLDEQILKEAPLVGKYFLNQGKIATYWPIKGERVRGVSAEPKHKVLIIGTDGDPATPYEMAVNVAKDIENSYLLTWKQFTHGAYGGGSHCIQDIVDNYLLTGVLPKEANKVCK